MIAIDGKQAGIDPLLEADLGLPKTDGTRRACLFRQSEVTVLPLEVILECLASL